MNRKNYRTQRLTAFSLVELSIVLVILGLLTGGILTGTSLIRAAELRNVTEEVERYKTATFAFREKYFYLPGDMPNATRFWGAQVGSTNDGVQSACITDITPATGKATCNGDGNGTISSLGAPAGLGQNYEIFRFWQHLANSGIIEGSYTGVAGSIVSTDVSIHSIVGVNVPALAIEGVGVTAMKRDGFAPVYTTSMFDLPYGNVFQIGRQIGDNSTWRAFLTPSESWNIDQKFDDSKPGTGKVIATERNICTTAASATDFNTEYRLQENEELCGLIFLMGL